MKEVRMLSGSTSPLRRTPTMEVIKLLWDEIICDCRVGEIECGGLNGQKKVEA